MGRKYFDVEEIIKEVEGKGLCQGGDILIDYSTCDFSHRLVQPPIVCYFITTVDEKGNTNCAPISMGNAVWGAPPDAGWYFAVGVINNRQTMANMRKTKECVISYYPYSLLKESHITGLPIPRGISEIEVAKMTPLESVKVKPCGIAECPNNIECKVVDTFRASGTTIFILKAVAVNVSEEIYEKDRNHPYQPGMVLADLMYEVSLNGKPERINYMRMDLEHVYRTGDELGDDTLWTGTFESWLESEEKRGRISGEERSEMLSLCADWLKNPDPVDNAEVKQRLTDMIKEMAWRETADGKN